MADTQRKIVQQTETLQSHWQSLRYPEALDAALELTRLAPEQGEYRVMAAIMYLGTKDYTNAVESYREGMRLDPGNDELRVYFTETMLNAGIDFYHPAIKSWILEMLDQPERIDIETLNNPWFLTLINDPDFKPMVPLFDLRAYGAFRAAFDAIPEAEAAKALGVYFTRGIACMITPHAGFENFLTHLRHRLLDHVMAGEKLSGWKAVLAEGLSLQCFQNEYVFYETAEETALIGKLVQSGVTAGNILVLSAYRRLMACEKIVPSLRRPWARLLLPQLARIIRQQIDEPVQEQKLAQKIPSLSVVQDQVSRSVQDQYEANPYPRWGSVGRVAKDRDMLGFRQIGPDFAPDILIAGCGTGRHAALVCTRHKNAKILGLDLSRASLGYAQRKANELGLKNLSFMQGDILDLDRYDKKFGVIESDGVLHHMQDPERGWKILVDHLEPGGMMKIALYSALARSRITEGQKFLAEKKFPATEAGLREARRTLIDLPDDHPLSILKTYYDFYSSSMFRDMLMHVREQCFTIPRIGAALRAMNMEFLGFVMPSRQVAEAYRLAYPQDATMTDLESLDQFEHAHPETFLAMYQFWCRKPER
jgi:SAM-dependent methyltransferase